MRLDWESLRFHLSKKLYWGKTSVGPNPYDKFCKDKQGGLQKHQLQSDSAPMILVSFPAGWHQALAEQWWWTSNKTELVPCGRWEGPSEDAGLWSQGVLRSLWGTCERGSNNRSRHWWNQLFPYKHLLSSNPDFRGSLDSSNKCCFFFWEGWNIMIHNEWSWWLWTVFSKVDRPTRRIWEAEP